MARNLTRSPKAPKTHSKKKSKRKSVYSIRFKLVLAILVPVVFIVLLGINSYQKASKALIENYEASTKNTVKITADYYDLIIGSLESIAYDTVLDATTKNYFTGVYDINPVDKWNTEASLIQNATSTVTGNEFLRSILIVPEQFGSVIYSDTKVDASFYKDIEASEYARALESASYIWVGDHSQFDETLKTDTSKYSMSLIRVLYNTYFRKAGYAIFDVDYDNFKKKIADTNICEGAVIALITPDGRELSARMLKEGEMEDVTRPDDYVSNEPFIATLTEESGSDYVEYMGESYLMVYQKLASEGFTVIALVPEAVIVEDAQLIFKSTVNFVIISCIVAIIVGTIISESFLKAIRQMTKGLSKASEGDLTVRISTKSKDEFLTLSESINDMIDHVRHLLTKANSVNEVVDAASEEVSANADVMLNSTIEIKNSIAEIDAGIVGQAEDAEKCLHQMDALADQIEEVAKSAGNIADISNKTRGIVTNGLTTIDELKEKSNDTRAVTEQVIKSIEELNESSASIEEIIGVINSIAGRTSLLSLNATIEAARAGEYGRGFSVVADEIRKLAEQSMESVKNIQSIVGDIREQTQTTVEVARKSSEIVKSQDETLTRTVEVFTSIDEHVASLTGDLDSILDEIKTIEIAKKETLQAIESISAISEETAAVTSTVQDSAQSQLEAAETLANAAKALRTDSEDLSTAIHMFTV